MGATQGEDGVTQRVFPPYMPGLVRCTSSVSPHGAHHQCAMGGAVAARPKARQAILYTAVMEAPRARRSTMYQRLATRVARR